MSEKQKELLVKIQETEKTLQSLKKELENSKNIRPLETLTSDSSLKEIQGAFICASFYAPIEIRRGGEYKNCSLYLGTLGKWEMVKDSEGCIVLILKELRKKIDESLKNV
jgi:hypothetical protein